jgi:hypothetical protein
VIPNKIGDRLISTEELLGMNLKRPDASPDALLWDKLQPGDLFVRQTVVLPQTIRRNQETEQQLPQVRHAQHPLKEYGPRSPGVLVGISLHLCTPSVHCVNV